MRKGIFLILTIFLIYSVIVFPQESQKTITITTYYPSPYGVYKVLRLYPTTDINPSSPCNREGEIFYYNTDDTLYYCDGIDWIPVRGGGFWTQSGSNLYPNDTNWRVGIGLTNPNNTIQVADLINFDNSLYNTFLGYQAGHSNTTGNGNTFLGYVAGIGNSTGSYNTFLGFQAGSSNSGSCNTFVGHLAGYSNSDGDNNTFLGNEAGRDNTTGNANTFLGYWAGYSNTTGDSNTFLGTRAGESNTTGFGNTFLGFLAGISNTTGYHNTLVGTNANVSRGDLVNATAIGYGAVVNASNKVRIGNNHVTVIEGEVDWSFSSDVRKKEDIRDCDLGLSFIMKLRPRVFKKKNGNGKFDYGFIAQEVEEALEGRDTNMVYTSEDNFKYLRITDLIAPLTKAVQEQQEQIQKLQREIEILKAEVRQLKKR